MLDIQPCGEATPQSLQFLFALGRGIDPVMQRFSCIHSLEVELLGHMLPQLIPLPHLFHVLRSDRRQRCFGGLEPSHAGTEDVAKNGPDPDSVQRKLVDVSNRGPQQL